MFFNKSPRTGSANSAVSANLSDLGLNLCLSKIALDFYFGALNILLNDPSFIKSLHHIKDHYLYYTSYIGQFLRYLFF
jgi:hypothetical protein